MAIAHAEMQRGCDRNGLRGRSGGEEVLTNKLTRFDRARSCGKTRGGGGSAGNACRHFSISTLGFPVRMDAIDERKSWGIDLR